MKSLSTVGLLSITLKKSISGVEHKVPGGGEIDRV